MFPQSELDNYKLQVELLQEKLQRSEISRQQLEHKLDKILQKRDEHDKMVRSKAKQKYQQFLEEQQRRNERNKQLVQMLERIEQQTEAMNARSERLKMMKLQYEMYFAKMVHSQTRRCIQNSVTPLAPTQFTPITTTTNLKPNIDPVTMEGYQYVNNVEVSPASFMVNNYQRYVTMPPSNEKEQLLRTPQDIMPLEMPTLTNFPKSERNYCMDDFRQLNVAPSMPAQQQQLYQYHPKFETNNNNVGLPINGNFDKQAVEVNSISSPTPTNTNMTLSSVTNLLPKDKQFTEFKESSNLSTPISSTFGEAPNVTMISQNGSKLKDIPNNTTKITKTFIETNNSATVSENVQSRQVQMPNINQVPSTNQNDKILTQVSQNVKPDEIISSQIQEIKNPVINEIKSEDLTPKLQDKPITSLEIEPTKSVIQTSTTDSNNSNYINDEAKSNEQTNPPNTSETLPKTESNTSSTPVSIENIENAIYGELLSPLETEEIQKAESSTVDPTLLENLVTQPPENIEAENIQLEEPPENQVNSPNNTTTNDNNVTAQEGSEQIVDTQNYEQNLNYDEYNNTQPQPNETTSNAANYNYENAEGTNIDENQQQQQYDYSNYDPSQYSYPGYIYDETTGEYKPDPNAPADQYATDQQYTAEGYDQQYQQQEVYDYNQTYNQDPTNSTENVENIDYNNYDTTSQEESSSNNVQDVVQPEAIAEPEVSQPEIPNEDNTQATPKITKPTSILSTADKNDPQKKKKRVNFVDSSETDESGLAEKAAASSSKSPAAENVAASSESDFDFSSSTEPEVKAT